MKQHNISLMIYMFSEILGTVHLARFRTVPQLETWLEVKWVLDMQGE